MNNKVLVKLLIPEIDETYDIYIPINLRIGTVVKLIDSSLNEITQGLYSKNNHKSIYNADTAEAYAINDLVRETNIRNGSVVVLM